MQGIVLHEPALADAVHKKYVVGDPQPVQVFGAHGAQRLQRRPLERARRRHIPRGPADQYQVAAGVVGGRLKHGAEGADDVRAVLDAQLVHGQPLAGHTAGSQLGAARLEVLERVQVAAAAHPRVDRVAGDHVVQLVGGLHIGARVGHDDVLRPVADEGRRLHHGAFDLHDAHALRLVQRDGLPGRAHAQANDQHALRVGVQRERQVAEQR